MNFQSYVLETVQPYFIMSNLQMMSLQKIWLH